MTCNILHNRIEDTTPTVLEEAHLRRRRFKDPLSVPMDIQYQIAHYGDDQRPQYLAGITICIVMVLVSLSARLYAQYLIQKLWQPDNWLAIIAAVRVLSNFHLARCLTSQKLFTLGVDATCIVSIKNGLGLHSVDTVFCETH